MKASAHSCVNDSCCALYTVILVAVPGSVPPSEPEFEHPEIVSTAAVASATPDISPIRILIDCPSLPQRDLFQPSSGE